MMNWGWQYGGGMGLWWLFGLLCLVILAVAVVWLLTAIARGNRHEPPHQPWQPPYGGLPYGMPPGPAAGPARQTPYEILRERLARGEITIEDYQRTLDALGAEGAPPVQPPATQNPPQGPVPPPSF